MGLLQKELGYKSDVADIVSRAGQGDFSKKGNASGIVRSETFGDLVAVCEWPGDEIFRYVNVYMDGDREVANFMLSRSSRLPVWDLFHRDVDIDMQRNGFGTLCMDIIEGCTAMTDRPIVWANPIVYYSRGRGRGNVAVVQANAWRMLAARGYRPVDGQSRLTMDRLSAFERGNRGVGLIEAPDSRGNSVIYQSGGVSQKLELAMQKILR